MEAKEMFENLDYKCSTTGTSVLYTSIEDTNNMIYFNDKDKVLEVNGVKADTPWSMAEVELGLPLIKAIIQQILELRWLSHE